MHRSAGAITSVDGRKGGGRKTRGKHLREYASVDRPASQRTPTSLSEWQSRGRDGGEGGPRSLKTVTQNFLMF